MKINARLDLNYSATQQAEWIKKKKKKLYSMNIFCIIHSTMSNVLMWYFDDTVDFCHDKERKDKLLKHLLMGELICSSTVVLL